MPLTDEEKKRLSDVVSQWNKDPAQVQETVEVLSKGMDGVQPASPSQMERLIEIMGMAGPTDPGTDPEILRSIFQSNFPANVGFSIDKFTPIAIAAFQHFAGLNPTGRLSASTVRRIIPRATEQIVYQTAGTVPSGGSK